MFGHQDDQPQDSTAPVFPPEDLLTAGDDTTNQANPAVSPTVGAPTTNTTDSSDNTDDKSSTLPPDLSAPSLSDESTPSNPTVTTPDFSAPTTSPVTPTAAPSTDDLLDIKQSALQQLSPLVSKLDQTPEEKFRTTMMMIQAADDQSLIKTAYEAAQQITDEKAKAQALLDVVNEINYFTQHQA